MSLKSRKLPSVYEFCQDFEIWYYKREDVDKSMNDFLNTHYGEFYSKVYNQIQFNLIGYKVEELHKELKKWEPLRDSKVVDILLEIGYDREDKWEA